MRERTEIIAITVPILIEAIAVTFIIGVAILWVAIYATRMPVPA